MDKPLKYPEKWKNISYNYKGDYALLFELHKMYKMGKSINRESRLTSAQS